MPNYILDNALDKSYGQYVFILLIAITILFVATYINKKIKNPDEHFGGDSNNKKMYWSRNTCKYEMGKTFENELKTNNIDYSNKYWDIIFPCSYDDQEDEINKMPLEESRKYFIIDNADSIVAKEWLWKNIENHYGLEYAKILLPNSYVLYTDEDIKRFNEEYDSKKLYIMKKNIQRQEGLKITNSKEEILKGYNNGFVVVQELLQNPYIISGRKTNMRFYVLVMCESGKYKVYVHKDGFMYYTKDLFKKNSLEEGPNITTGYIDRQVYIDNPLTHDDLRKYLDDDNRELSKIEKHIRWQGLKVSQVCFSKIYRMLEQVFVTFVGKICRKGNKLQNNMSFQLFGVDVAVNDELNPMIIEINKGPDMGAKDKRDSELKHGVVKDIFRLGGLINDEKQNKFIQIIDIDNGNIKN